MENILCTYVQVRTSIFLIFFFQKFLDKPMWIIYLVDQIAESVVVAESRIFFRNLLLKIVCELFVLMTLGQYPLVLNPVSLALSEVRST